MTTEIKIHRPEVLTTKLNAWGGFARVLAKETPRYGISAVGYANLTQARKSAEGLRMNGVACEVIGRRPFYVRIDD